MKDEDTLIILSYVLIIQNEIENRQLFVLHVNKRWETIRK